MQSLLFFIDASFLTYSRAILILPIVGLLLGLSGCSSPPPEEEVGRRASERWQALIQGDFNRAYEYLSPGYRAVNSFDLYRARIGQAVQWKEATLKNVSCADKACEVTVNIRYRYANPRVGNYEGERPIKEKWTEVDGEWWFLPED
ncbi:hypothetical protein [Nitrosococcus wardiae]|uniref:Uncharacterized protein n=1 Tax=Nitrosococcus wardiae TaxID=1814290 RepID=A0A4P7BYI1_9GAMM|nr:hypothetical protein [Nitrosococcus wardiae]QBQ53532.1 hypothetical protein E3U44_02690 [Nitrosococcus wardiae]